MPIRVQLSRKKGWRMPPNTVKVCRPTKWGNPFSVDVFGRDVAIRLYREMVTGCWGPGFLTTVALTLAAVELHDQWRERFTRLYGGRRHHPREAAREELLGKNIACWCPLDQPCHADVLLKIANNGA